MGKIDPEQERARLAARYAAMSDMELRKVGGDPTLLTEWARNAFGEEMKKRGMEWKPETRIAKPISDGEILIRLGIYADRNSAGLVRDFLAGPGIKAYFFEEESAGESQNPQTDGGKKTSLLVRAKDLMAARELLVEKRDAEVATRRPSEEASEDDRPVVLRRYRDMPAAFVEKSVLEDAGVECFLQDDNVVRMDWLWSNAMGGIKLIVREKDAEEAEKILNQGPPAEQPGEGGEASKD
jgi:Putative prokaryotic signal transducing protein